MSAEKERRLSQITRQSPGLMRELHGRLRATSVSAHTLKPSLQQVSQEKDASPTYAERIHRRIRFLEDVATPADAAEKREKRRLASAVVAANVWLRRVREGKAKAAAAAEARAGKATTRSVSPRQQEATQRRTVAIANGTVLKEGKGAHGHVMTSGSPKVDTRKPERKSEPPAASPLTALSAHAEGAEAAGKMAQTSGLGGAEDEERGEEGVERGANDPFILRYRRPSVVDQNDSYQSFKLEEFTAALDSRIKSRNEKMKEMEEWIRGGSEMRSPPPPSPTATGMTSPNGRPVDARFASPLSSPAPLSAGSLSFASANSRFDAASLPSSPSHTHSGGQSLSFLNDSLNRFGAWKPSPSSHGYASDCSTASSSGASPLRYLQHQQYRLEDERLNRRLHNYAASLSPSPLAGQTQSSHSPGGFPGFYSSSSPGMRSSPAIDHIRVFSP